MATPKNATESAFQVEVTNLASGFTNNTSSILSSLVVDGVSMNRAEIITTLEVLLSLLAAVLQTKQAYAAAVAAKKAGLLTGRPFVVSLVLALEQTLGAANQAQLSAFGILPPKQRTQPTAERKAIAKAKGQATRQARGTMSKKQKQAITATPEPTLQILGPGGKPLLSPGGNAPAATSNSASPAGSAPAGSGSGASPNKS